MGSGHDIAGLGILLASAAIGRTLGVPGDFAQIQAAIDAAQEGDTVLVQPGTYVETLDFVGKQLVLTSTAPADSEVVAKTVVDADSCGSVVSFTSGEGTGAVIRGFTLTGGTGTVYRWGPSGGESYAGGGVYCEASNPVIDRCVIADNQVTIGSSRGGGIHAHTGSAAVINRCRIIRNGADRVTDQGLATLEQQGEALHDKGHFSPGWGGGISLWDASALIRSSIILGNTASWGGGGIMCTSDSELLLVDSEIRDNVGYGGAGGIYCDGDARMRAVDCSLQGNTHETVWAYGGAVEVTSSAAAEFIRCGFFGNAAQGSESAGGAIYVSYRGGAAFYNCSFIGNQARGLGGAAYCHGHIEAPPVLFKNCLFQGNAATDEGAFGGALVVGAGATIRLTNCTLTENFAAGIGGAISASGYAELYNCISWGNIPNELNHGALVQFTDIAGGYQGEGNIDSDPLFRQYRGFPYVLSAASPCIDAGDPALEDGISDWHPRWPHGHPNDTRSDMGAYGGPGNVAWIEH